jgi:hypothetical protein
MFAKCIFNFSIHPKSQVAHNLLKIGSSWFSGSAPIADGTSADVPTGTGKEKAFYKLRTDRISENPNHRENSRSLGKTRSPVTSFY